MFKHLYVEKGLIFELAIQHKDSCDESGIGGRGQKRKDMSSVVLFCLVFPFSLRFLPAENVDGNRSDFPGQQI